MAVARTVHAAAAAATVIVVVVVIEVHFHFAAAAAGFGRALGHRPVFFRVIVFFARVGAGGAGTYEKEKV